VSSFRVITESETGHPEWQSVRLARHIGTGELAIVVADAVTQVPVVADPPRATMAGEPEGTHADNHPAPTAPGEPTELRKAGPVEPIEPTVRRGPGRPRNEDRRP
jgi:hypothetical protein